MILYCNRPRKSFTPNTGLPHCAGCRPWKRRPRNVGDSLSGRPSGKRGLSVFRLVLRSTPTDSARTRSDASVLNSVHHLATAQRHLGPLISARRRPLLILFFFCTLPRANCHSRLLSRTGFGSLVLLAGRFPCQKQLGLILPPALGDLLVWNGVQQVSWQET